MNQDEEWLLWEKYNGKKTEGFFADVSRLESQEPLAYVIGSIPFLHTTIHLDSHPLIPRVETEYWVEKIIKKMQSDLDRNESSIKVLDLCAGSGCIGVAILKDVPEASVDFGEIDTRHHSTIQKNITTNEINHSRAHIFGGDLFENVTKQYDYIFSNPPYINPARDTVAESVKTFEPALALYGGNDGTECIFIIIEQAPQFLTEGGTLVIEHEPEQVDALHLHSKPYGFECTTFPDQYGVSRYTVLVRQ